VTLKSSRQRDYIKRGIRVSFLERLCIDLSLIHAEIDLKINNAKVWLCRLGNWVHYLKCEVGFPVAFVFCIVIFGIS